MVETEKKNGNGNGFDAKSDHEIIVLLESQVHDLQDRLGESEKDRSNLIMLQGQISIVRLVFAGICGLLMATLITAIFSWYTPKANLSTEKVIALSERILLVLTGILSSVVAGFGDNRNHKES